MHNSPNRGVNYHIFQNKGNYPVIPIYYGGIYFLLRRMVNWWKDLVVMTARCYDEPGGGLGHSFVRKINAGLAGIQECICNTEHFIIFQTVILKFSRNVIGNQSIRRCISTQINAWEVEKYQIMFQYKAHTLEQ